MLADSDTKQIAELSRQLEAVKSKVNALLSLVAMAAAVPPAWAVDKVISTYVPEPFTLAEYVAVPAVWMLVAGALIVRFQADD